VTNALARRGFLALCAASLYARRGSAEAAWPADSPFERIELGFDGKRFGKRCFAFLPKRAAGKQLRCLLLFHGLGETDSEANGIRAYSERYGLLDAYARLLTPPIARTLPAQDYLGLERMAALDRELGEHAMGDLAILCPFTPNPYKDARSAPLLDSYAAFIERTLLPAACARLPLCAEPAAWGIDGVSLGGYVSLEIFLRRPERFGAVGSTQGAFGVALAEVYARRIRETLAKVGPRKFHFSTSSYDPSRASSELLASRLVEQGISATLSLAPGPHDQRWLREVGCLELLLWQDRALVPS
jgi:hypothetical protein